MDILRRTHNHKIYQDSIPRMNTRRRTAKHFVYASQQIHHHGNDKTVHRVTVKNGKGHKSVTKYRRGKLMSRVKRLLREEEMEHIHRKKFIPGLFRDCIGMCWNGGGSLLRYNIILFWRIVWFDKIFAKYIVIAKCIYWDYLQSMAVILEIF